MVSSCQQVVEGSHQYEIENGQIGYKEFGSINFNMFYGYLTTFAYYQEFNKTNISQEKLNDISGINISCGSLAYDQIPQKYAQILGVTGTLETLHEQSHTILKKYIQAQTIIPSMFGENRCKFDTSQDVLVEKDIDNWFIKIGQEANKYIQDGRPVLIFFQDEKLLNEFYNSPQLIQKKEDVLTLKHNTKNIYITIQQAVRQSQLTLIDRQFGRGTDFYTQNKKIDLKGGIVVIQTFLSEDFSEQVQIRGRTGRQQNEGLYRLILNAKDIVAEFHLKEQDVIDRFPAMATMYSYLDPERTKYWGKKLQILEEANTKANLKNEQTLKLITGLKDNSKRLVIQLLMEFNNANITQKGEVDQYYHFILALDDSGSMSCPDSGSKTRWQSLIDSVFGFVQERNNQTDGQSEDIFSVIYHSHQSRKIMQYEKLENVTNKISQNQPIWGGNNFYLAIDDINRILEGEKPGPNGKPYKKIILFLSDGGDCESNRTLLPNSINNLISKHKQNISFWWNMGFGSGADGSILQQMTQWTKDVNGQYKTAINASELQHEFTILANPQATNMRR